MQKEDAEERYKYKDAGELKMKKIIVRTGLTNIHKPLAHFSLKKGLDIASVVKNLKLTW